MLYCRSTILQPKKREKGTQGYVSIRSYFSESLKHSPDLCSRPIGLLAVVPTF